MAVPPQQPQQPPRRGGGVGFFIGGGLIALVALGLILAGLVALWAYGRGDDDGFISTSSESLTTDSAALLTDGLDIDLEGAEGVVDTGALGTLRFSVDPATDKPVFLGIARTSEVRAYLRGVAYTRVVDFENPDYRRAPGARRPAPPSDRVDWTESAEGSGEQSVIWEMEDGDWSVVAMNADGSPGVDVDAKAAIKLPWLNELGWIVLGIGIVLAIMALLLIRAGVRRSSA
jgi:hypothetical protein